MFAIQNRKRGAADFWLAGSPDLMTSVMAVPLGLGRTHTLSRACEPSIQTVVVQSRTKGGIYCWKMSSYCILFVYLFIHLFMSLDRIKHMKLCCFIVLWILKFFNKIKLLAVCVLYCMCFWHVKEYKRNMNRRISGCCLCVYWKVCSFR